MKKPLIWAHRGASGYAPENTLAAFQKAVEQGADGVELDVQLSRDQEIVICHDERIDRTSNGTGNLRDYTLDELRGFDFFNGNLKFAGEKIPTLAEVFDLLAPTGLTINIELKTGIFFYPGIEERVLSLTKEAHFSERVIFSSFNHYSVRRIKELCPSAKTGLLYADGPVDVASYGARLGVDALHPALYNLQYPGFMEESRKIGLAVNVWTVNEREHFKWCGELGVDAVITNYPDQAKAFYKTEDMQ